MAQSEKKSRKKLSLEQLRINNEKRVRDYMDFLNTPRHRKKYIGNTIIDRTSIYQFLQRAVTADKILSKERVVLAKAIEQELAKGKTRQSEIEKELKTPMLSSTKEDELRAEYSSEFDKRTDLWEKLHHYNRLASELALADLFLHHLKVSNDIIHDFEKDLDMDFSFISDN